MLLYLNGEGTTWFPLAAADADDAIENPRSRAAALQACAGLVPGRDGLLVGPAKGDAVAFYNFMDDGSGQLDRLAFHAGMPAQSEKSIAALWYHLGEGALEQDKPKFVRLSSNKQKGSAEGHADRKSARKSKKDRKSSKGFQR